MAVQVWIGEKPENPNERKAIIALASGLDRLEGLYVMLANFSVGGRTIDLVILKHDAIFILELKHCDGRVFGSVNGPWSVVSKGGSTKQLNPGRKNPYNQVISYFYSFTNFLIDHREEVVSSQKATDIDFRLAKRVIVSIPTLEPGSEVELDWKVQIKGLDELPTYLVVERSNGLELSDAALQRIPKLLHCTVWQEVHDLLAGVMPPWEQTPSDPRPAPPAVVAAPAPPPTVAAPRRRHPLRWMAGGGVSVFVALTVWWAIWVNRSQPETTAAPVNLAAAASNVTAVALPTIPPGGSIADDVSNGVTTVRQTIRRSWDSSQKRWLWAEDSKDSRADVVVTLETVNFNDGKITLNWTIENRRKNMLYVPLTESNIAISDDTLQYKVDPRLSQPPGGIYVQAGERAAVVVVVPQPVRSSAMTLKISLLRAPFDKATWIVNVK